MTDTFEYRSPPRRLPDAPAHLKRYVDYIHNTGQARLDTKYFDEDWAPIGPKVRADLLAAGLTSEEWGQMILIYDYEDAW